VDVHGSSIATQSIVMAVPVEASDQPIASVSATASEPVASVARPVAVIEMLTFVEFVEA
jgi:hypothetical protein